MKERLRGLEELDLRNGEKWYRKYNYAHTAYAAPVAWIDHELTKTYIRVTFEEA